MNVAPPPALESPTDFRSYLQQEFVSRCRRNPSYSLRAFARQLGVESSRLSKMLRGERPIRGAMIEQIGLKIGLSPDKLERFEQNSSYKTRLKHINMDTFQVISDWQHFAILQLMQCDGFREDAKWIARKLGTTPTAIRGCIERLERSGLLVVTEQGWVDKSEGVSTHTLGENVTNHALRRFQEDVLQLALAALNDVPVEKRDQSSMMMATSRSRMAEAKKRIKKFRRELCEYLETAPTKDAVYQLSVSLYPLTKELT